MAKGLPATQTYNCLPKTDSNISLSLSPLSLSLSLSLSLFTSLPLSAILYLSLCCVREQTSTRPQHPNTFPTPLPLLNSPPTLPPHLLDTSPTIPQHLPITSSTPTQHFPSMFPSGQTSQPDPLESRYTRSTCYSFSRHIYPKRQTK